MARTKTDKAEDLKSKVQEVEDVQEELDIAVTNRTFVLNGYNYTAVGETFLSLCKPKIVIPSNKSNLIKVAEEQVKLGFLKEEK